MKKIVTAILILIFSMSAKAQFSNTDTLRRFINHWVRNSAVEAFQNLRLNTALIGMTNFLDSSYGGQVVSFTAVNDTTLRIITVGGDTLTAIANGKALTLQQVLANGSTLTSNFTITLADSLKFTSGKVIMTDSVKMSGLPSTSDSTNKPVVKDANGNLKAMSYWPGGGGGLANNGLSTNGDTTQLGQTVSAVGDPAILNTDREIPMNGKSIYLKNTSNSQQGIQFSGIGRITATRYEATDTTDNDTPVSAFRVNRVLSSEINGSGHGFRDQTLFKRPGYAYCAFDAAPAIDVVGSFDHLIGFQSRISMNWGTVNDFYGGATLMNIGSTVSITRAYGWDVWDLNGSGATINDYFGYHVRSLTKGTRNWAFYSEGTSTPSLLRGKLGLGLATLTAPAEMLDVSGNGQFTGNIYFKDTTAAHVIRPSLAITNSIPYEVRVQSNTNVLNDNAGGAALEMHADVGDVSSGGMYLFAYSKNGSARAGDFRFISRSGVNTYTERVSINSNGNVGINTTSSPSKLAITTASLGTTQNDSAGIVLQNTTAAAAGSQQISPAITWNGFGWKTASTAASQAVNFRAFNLPVQGSSAPTGLWKLQSSINGGAYSDAFSVTSDGNLTSYGGMFLSTQSVFDFGINGTLNNSFRLTTANIAGTGDVVVQGRADVGTGYYVIENSNGAGMVLSTFGSNPIKFWPNRTQAGLFNGSGEFQIGSATDQGAYTLQNTGGLYQNGVFHLRGTMAPPSTYTLLVHGADSNVYQIPSSTFVTSAITSINSMTGPAITITAGTGMNTSSASNDVTISVNTTSNNLPHTLNNQVNDAGISGTSETDLYSYTLAANTLTTTGRSVHFEISGSENDASVTTYTMKMYFGSNNWNTTTFTAASTGHWTARGYLMRSGTTTARAHITWVFAGQAITTETDLTALDFTTTNIFKISGQATGGGAGTDDIIAKTWKLIYWPE